MTMTQEKTCQAKEQARAQLDSIMEMVKALETGEEIDGEDAHDRIQEDPLSVEVRTDRRGRIKTMVVPGKDIK